MDFGTDDKGDIAEDNSYSRLQNRVRIIVFFLSSIAKVRLMHCPNKGYIDLVIDLAKDDDNL